MSDEGLLVCDEFWNPNGRDKSNFDYQSQFDWVHLKETEQIVGVAVDTISDENRILPKWLLGSGAEKHDTSG